MRWENIKYSDSMHTYYAKQHYMATRQLYLDIFNHNQVLAYPFECEVDNNEDNDEDNGMTAVRESWDRFESLWSTKTREYGTGAMIGPLMIRKSLKLPFNHAKSNPTNLTSNNVQTFLDTMIPDLLSLVMYKPFMNTFNAHKQKDVSHY